MCLIPLPPYLQAKIQKHQAFEAEVAAHSNAIVVLDNTGMEMINQGHFQQSSIRGTSKMPTFDHFCPLLTHFQPTFLFVILARLEELHQLWELLLKKLSEKGLKLQQALVLVQYFR